MNIPNYSDMKFVQADGYLTPAQQIFIDDLIQTLQAGLSNNGWTWPRLTTAEITAIAPQMPGGTVWFNTTLQKGQIRNDAGVIETIQSV